ncbi:TetR family transcriptional regulator [Nocardioides sp. SYSU D00038]|uniref:TetR family transcriptional regulator n=1 Tax=Nocardioides sp. SYSU D00038 TaxID=2812554 RepID=UPI001967530A|nr:TetR family transcriptional regulator [Nocardioides sp. SYSU D00038]
MGHRRDAVVAAALAVLDGFGLADLTMRRLAAELDVRPSALYHHFRTKQLLLAEVADEILRRGHRPARLDDPGAPWDERVAAVCAGLREAVLAWRDGAELVTTVRAYGLGAAAPHDELVVLLVEAGCDPSLADTAARTLLHFVLGHATDEQLHLQAGSAGAIDDAPRPASDFATGLEGGLAGSRRRVGSAAAR